MEEMFRFLQRVAPYRGVFLLLSELISLKQIQYDYYHLM